MKLGLIIEGEYDEPVISELANRICEQSGCPVDISQKRIRIGRGFGGITKNLSAFARQLQDAGSEVIVLVADNDRKPLNSRLDFLRSKIEGQISVPVAVGIAVETVEAWLLADEQALGSALGDKRIPRLPLSKIKHPKEELAQVVKRYADQPVSRDLYGKIANKADKKVLDRKCKCFKRFHNELKACLKMVQSDT